MARIRTVKPEFWDDEKLAAVSRDARLLYIGMWNFSDDFGVIKANPVWLKSKIFPFDDIQLANFKKWLEMLERPGFSSPGGSVAWVIPFSANGEAFYYLPNFSRHQRVDKPSTHNRNPEVPAEIKDWKGIPHPVVEGSPSPPGALAPVLEGKVGEGKGGYKPAAQAKAGKPKGEPEPDPDVTAVYRFWKKLIKASTRKADALKWIERRGKEHGFETVVMSIVRYKNECNEKKTEEKFLKECANFFGEDATYEGFLPDPDFHIRYLDRALAVLKGEDEKEG